MGKKIRITRDGPYIVSGDVKLVQAVIVTDEDGASESWESGREYPAQETYSLCRCGHSKNKPYCDGAHAAAGFDGTETAPHGEDAASIKKYIGEELDLIDEESLCASLRFCDKGIGVWDAVLESSRESNRELAIDEACNCASGRLTVVNKKGEPYEPRLDQEISPIEDTAEKCRGPLWVKGGIELEGADGRAYKKRNRMTLCRCGESSNMPFCDISHMNCPHMRGFDE